MISDVLAEAKEKMRKAVEVAKDDFSGVRTGRANPALFQKLLVDYYGTPTPLAQLAGLHNSDARTLIITPVRQGRAQGDREGHRGRPNLGASVGERRHHRPGHPAGADPGPPQGIREARARARAKTPRLRSATSGARPRTTSTR